MSNVGYATLSVIPSARGFRGKLEKEINAPLAAAGRSGGRTMGRGMVGGIVPTLSKATGVIGAALGLGVIAKSAIDLEKTFSQTMATMGAVANVPKVEIKALSDLALKMGADTVFSANEAADAMLELAKGGMSAATIQAGGLAGTLTLATAGGTDLATAATIAANSMAQFNLDGSQMESVAAALAGGANASTASIESLGEALSQVGPGAKGVGFSLQETVAALSAFDKAGIKGSDAGTSLKTMLAALTPETKRAREAMADLGINFINTDGSFKSLTEISGILQKQLKGLTPAARDAALSAMFGSDAYRAAAVLANEGAAGIGEFIKATNDSGAATRVAEARMSGTAGAIERMSGAAETAKLALGQALAPAVAGGADLLANGFEGIAVGVGKATPLVSGFFSDMSKNAGGSGIGAALVKTGESVKEFASGLVGPLKEVGSDIMAVVGPGLKSVADVVTTVFLPGLQRILPVVRPVVAFLIGVLGTAVVGILKGAFAVIGGILRAIGGLFTTIAALITGDWSGAWEGIKNVVGGVTSAIWGAIQIFLNVGVLGAFRKVGSLVIGAFRGMWALLRGSATSGLNAVKGLFTSGLNAIGRGIVGAIKGYFGMWRSLFSTVRSIVVNGWNVLRSAFGGALAAIRTVVANAFSAVRTSVSSAMGNVRTAVSDGVSNVLSTIRGLPGRITSALGNLGGLLKSAGGDLIRGFIRGITDTAGGIVSAITASITDKIPKFVRDKLGIHSPSRVFMEIGGHVGDGMAIGIERSAGRVTKAADALAYTPSLSGGAGTVGANGAGPLVGSLQLTSTGNVRDDLEEVRWHLRQIAQGGVHA